MGLLAGYFRGIVDEIIMRGVDVMLCFLLFPYPCRYCVFRTKPQYDYGGHRADLMDGGPVGPCGNPFPARTGFCRGRPVGRYPPFRIMVMHILPNALTPVLVSATLGIAEPFWWSLHSAFGLGVQPPDPSWGNMLMEGKDVLEIAPWLSLYPGLAILITVLGYNLLGESLRDTLDPRLKR